MNKTTLTFTLTLAAELASSLKACNNHSIREVRRMFKQAFAAMCLLTILLLKLIALMAIASSASAAPLLTFYGSCGANIGTIGDNCINQAGTTSGPSVVGADSASAFVTSGDTFGGGNAAASYAFGVQYGQLGAGVTAFTASNTGANGSMGGNAVGAATAQVHFADEITPYSNTLDIGTPISINYQIPIHFFITSSLSAGGNDYFNFDVGWVLGDVQGSYAGSGSNSIDETNLFYSGSFIAHIGEASFIFEGIDIFLNASASTWFSDDGSVHNGFADINANFQNTVKLFLEADDPNVMLVAASGHDYAPAISSIPEPATLAMVFPGLVGLIWYRRRVVK